MSGIVVLVLRLLLVICLYGFLIYALYTLWQELMTGSQLLSIKTIPEIEIFIIDDSPQARVQSFKNSEIVIGRNPDCDLTILAETVSSHHARLTYHHNQWWIADLHSRNGTFLNDVQVETQTVMISNDEICCGNVRMKINIK